MSHYTLRGVEHSSGAGPATRAVLDVGSVIADTYRIEALIGRGGMGAVFLASHLRLPGKRVAIKLLHAGEGDTELLARFRREAEIATRLGHPNIVAVHDFNLTPDGTPYLVLEYLEGITLASGSPRARCGSTTSARSCARSVVRSPPRTPPGSSTAISSPRTSSW